MASAVASPLVGDIDGEPGLSAVVSPERGDADDVDISQSEEQGGCNDDA